MRWLIFLMTQEMCMVHDVTDYVHVMLAHCLQHVPVAWAMCYIFCLGICQAVE